VMAYEGNYEDYLRKKEQLAAAAETLNADKPGAASVRAGVSSQAWHAERSEGPAVGSQSAGTNRGALCQGTTSVVPNGATKGNGASAPAPIGQTIVIEGGPSKPRRLNPIKQKQMEDRCAFLEEEVPRIEASLEHTEQQLGIFISAEETQRLTKLAEDLRAQRDALTAEWEDLMLQLDA
jgi:ATP-binding cassette, subfamily F, member 3